MAFKGLRKVSKVCSRREAVGGRKTGLLHGR